MTRPTAPVSLRVVFAGTPGTAVPALRALAGGRHTVTGVITREDAPVGRKRTLTESDVAQEAARLGLPIVKANRPGERVVDHVRSWRPDLGVIVAYGGLLREPLLSAPVHGWINLHFSALPRWRGAAPVQRAILAGDTRTALDVFQLVRELDAGAILASRPESFLPDEPSGEALDRLAPIGAGVLTAAVDAIAEGTVRPQPQAGEPSYAAKLTRDDGRMDWRETAQDVYARFRAVTPEPGAFTTIATSEVKIHGMRLPADGPELSPGELHGVAEGVLVGTASTPLLITRLQPAGKRVMAATDWWRGNARAGLRAE
jgi:methionyl-tRNA formyltransferase